MPATYRRTLLRAAVPALLTGFLVGEATAQTPRERLLAVFSDLDAARAVGRIVWQGLPAGTTAEGLVAGLLARHAGIAQVLADGTIAELAAALHDAVGADFANGRTCIAAGWVLARAEADLCALSCSA